MYNLINELHSLDICCCFYLFTLYIFHLQSYLVYGAALFIFSSFENVIFELWIDVEQKEDFLKSTQRPYLRVLTFLLHSACAQLQSVHVYCNDVRTTE